MKAVLISIQPKWCELIASGKKTVEVRKTKPKIEIPFKCYIYATKPRNFFKISKHLLTSDENLFLVNGKVKMCEGFGVEYEDPDYKHLNCKVIGEFVCDKMLESFLNNNDGWFVELGCLSKEEIDKYQGDKAILYGWHISDLVIYDKPKELSEFRSYNVSTYIDGKFGLPMPTHEIKRPPQSYMYVEELR